MSDGQAATIDPPLGGSVPATRGLDRLLRWLDDASDGLSPIVVKEVRQIVRGREFNYSFLGSLAAGLIVAFIGAATAAGGAAASGRWVFTALTACLAFLGFVVVPFGAFSALRNERLEQTMDLITVTTLSPRRIVVGKLLAQGLKLATLFAGMAPFVAMSFLLGGIDFATILVSLTLVFLGSLSICATALFLSSIPKTRAMSGLLFVGVGIALLLVLGAGPIMFLLARTVTGIAGGGGAVSVGFVGGVTPVAGAPGWWLLAILTTLGLSGIVNMVLLTENRLSSPVEDKATALRIGFFVQFLLIGGLFTALAYFAPGIPGVVGPIATLCGLQLAIVAALVVTEDVVVSRRVLLRMAAARWRGLNAIMRPGGGRGALYVVVQMALLLAVVWSVGATGSDLRWVVALCGYICFFTGVPVVALRHLRPGISSFHLRVAILVLLSAAMVLPDLLYYVLWRPDSFLFGFGFRHLINPLRTLTNWTLVEGEGWFGVLLLLGGTGLTAYVALIEMNRRATREQVRAEEYPMAAGDASHAAAH